MRALLDVNVLIALLDGAHVMHDTALNWLKDEIGNGWASCPIAENGVIRVMSQPAYPNTQPAAQVALRLAEACAAEDHRFWSHDFSLLAEDLVDWSRLLGHRQVTDAYLLATAVRHGGRFVTFDQRVEVSLVRGASDEHLAGISAESAP